MKAIINGNVYFNEMFFKDFVVVFDEVIKDVLHYEEYKKTYKDLEEIDAKGDYVLPGFIDTHIHGYCNNDTMDGNESSLTSIKKELLKNGVTSFLPTTITASIEETEKTLENIQNVKNKNYQGAKILGVHLEGPFINEKFKGAHNEQYIINPNTNLIEKYKEILKIVTIAPEIEGANDIIEKYKDTINFQIGHSSACTVEALYAFENGIKGVTHLFNAMPPMHHRNPSVVGSALASDCYVELICDQIHVNPLLYDVVLNSKGVEKVLLITDCTRAGGLSDGHYDLGGLKINVTKGECRLEDGTLAGSTLKLNNALKNFYKCTGITLENAIKTVTINQAKYLNMDDEIGTISINKKSDIVIMDDNFFINMTIVNGEIAYS